ncbi:MAG: hypothetical protein AUJ60_03965 [Nitrospirae bacterium CG1_02_44_142]|nr:MAG: hypothetical protein AUJ60_03965 [Nitrospirae bacterium CG1_02_44_142]
MDIWLALSLLTVLGYFLSGLGYIMTAFRFGRKNILLGILLWMLPPLIPIVAIYYSLRGGIPKHTDVGSIFRLLLNNSLMILISGILLIIISLLIRDTFFGNSSF